VSYPTTEKEYIEEYAAFIIGWTYVDCGAEGGKCKTHRKCRVWKNRGYFNSPRWKTNSICTCETVEEAKFFICGVLHQSKLVKEALHETD